MLSHVTPFRFQFLRSAHGVHVGRFGALWGSCGAVLGVPWSRLGDLWGRLEVLVGRPEAPLAVWTISRGRLGPYRAL